MATVTPRSLRTASVGIRFPLSRFHASLAGAWNRSVERPGTPQGWDGVLTGELSSIAGEYLLSQILSKFDDGTPNPIKEENTWKRFHEAEDLCRETNHRLALSGIRGPYQGVLETTRYICKKILGSFNWDLAAEGMGWGPGASTRLPRRMSDAAYKYSGKPETTAGNAALAVACIRAIPAWERAVAIGQQGPLHLWDYISVVEGNRIVTVPKNYKADRTIAIEPEMNMYVQKGIGALMRKRLRFAGCNLDDQTRNQRLAKVGSFSGRLATIDLSMASDTVSRQIVSQLLPADWVQALEQARSQFGVLPSGEKIFYQKFSSMGNGFTFELESLIFYSLALAWCHHHGEEMSRVSVFGDDIILPSSVAGSFCGLLEFCGFKTNEQKSYWSGPFRESCGKHYYHGHEITPFFVRRPVKRLTDLFLLHNNIRRYLNRTEILDEGVRSALGKLAYWVRQYAPAKWRKPRIFDGYGDGAFIGDFDEVTPKPAPFGYEAWEATVLAEVSQLGLVDVPGLIVKGLERVSRKRKDSDIFFPRDSVPCLSQARREKIPPPSQPTEVYPVRGRRYREIKILMPQFALGRYLAGEMAR